MLLIRLPQMAYKSLSGSQSQYWGHGAVYLSLWWGTTFSLRLWTPCEI